MSGGGAPEHDDPSTDDFDLPAADLFAAHPLAMATFLPLVDEPSGKAAPDVRPTPIRRPGVATILLAEDEPAVRSLVERVLAQAGHRVMSAPDGIAAIDLAARNNEHIDLFLTDVVMPGPTGIEAARRIRVERPTLRVLYMSGWATEALVREGLREEEIRLLAKPFSVSELLEAVRVAIDEDAESA